MPREHGAYAQLAIPLAAALLAHASIAGALIAGASCLAFLANEPLLIVAGHRGARRREQDGARARRRLALATSGAAIAGAAGLVLAPADARLIAVPVGAAAIAVVALAWSRAQHSLAGELVAAFALTGASAPVAAAGGAPPRAVLATWAAWAIGYACTVLAVHRVIARHHAVPTAIDRVAAAALVATTIAAAACALWIAVPLAGIAAVLVLKPPPASRLRAIGVALVVASIASGAVVVAGAM
jgi:hypothetical protein